MRYFIIIFTFFICVSTAHSQDMKFGKWIGTYDKDGNKNLVGSSKTDNVTLTIYVDKQLITRLQFNPERKIRVATFDGKRIRGMNFDSLYGYDHWIRRMIKYYNMQVWFKGDKKPEVFKLKGISKGVRWLQSK